MKNESASGFGEPKTLHRPSVSRGTFQGWEVLQLFFKTVYQSSLFHLLVNYVLHLAFKQEFLYLIIYIGGYR